MGVHMAEQSQTSRGARLHVRRETRISNARSLATAGAALAPVLLALVLLPIASACRHGSSSPTGPSAPSRWCDGPSLGTMSATIDGTAWTPVRVSANSFGSSLELAASDCTYRLVVILQQVNGPATYTVAGGGISFAALELDGRGPEAWTANPTQGGSGSVTLTAFTKPTTLEDLDRARVSGVFSFTLIPLNTTGTKVITDGRFESGFAMF